MVVDICSSKEACVSKGVSEGMGRKAGEEVDAEDCGEILAAGVEVYCGGREADVRLMELVRQECGEAHTAIIAWRRSTLDALQNAYW